MERLADQYLVYESIDFSEGDYWDLYTRQLLAQCWDSSLLWPQYLEGQGIVSYTSTVYEPELSLYTVTRYYLVTHNIFLAMLIKFPDFRLAEPYHRIDYEPA